MTTTAANKFCLTARSLMVLGFAMIFALAPVVALSAAGDEPAAGKGKVSEKSDGEAGKPHKDLKDERSPGGDGSMFFRVFVSRNDKNGDGVIEKSEFRGSGDRFDRMDKNKNGKLDRAEIDELHRSRMADPLSMRQRIARGETRRPPSVRPSEQRGEKKAGEGVHAQEGDPFAVTPRGTRITAKQAFARLDADRDGKVTAAEFRRSPGMADAKTAAEVVAKIDQDGDGSLSFKEFNSVFSKRHGRKADAKEGAGKAPARKTEKPEK